jgi:hypothetical protein
MKASLPLLLMALGLLGSGCVSHYNITLNNNNVITARGKPKFDAATSSYVYKDANGRPTSIPAIRVKEIAPQ